MADLSRRVARLDKDHVRRKKYRQPEWLKNVDALDFLERLEVANISHATKDELIFSCPFPGHTHGDEKPSAYMNDGSVSKKDNTKFKCHGCSRGGNAISFLAEAEGISRQQATNKLKEVYAPGYAKPRDGIGAEFDRRRVELEEERKTLIAPHQMEIIEWKHYYKAFGVDWDSFAVGYEDKPDVSYMFGRGLEARTLEHWNIGFDHVSDRITIPICNPQGQLVGVKARAWAEDVKPKYMILGDKPEERQKGKGRRRKHEYGFKHYEKSMVVFGIDQWPDVDRFVFVEGEIDVISLWQLGIPAICTGGASMSDQQARMIRDHCNEVVVFLDDDLAGSHGVWGLDKEDGDHKPGIIEILEPFVRIKIVGKHRRDPNDYLRHGQFDRVESLIANAKPAYLLQRPEILL